MPIVLEIQTNEVPAVVNPVQAYTDHAAAEAAYHTTLAAAAQSAVKCHSVLLIADNGVVLKKETYNRV